MAYYEKRAELNGVPLPIECLTMTQMKDRPPRLHYHDYTELLFGTEGCAKVWISTRQYLLGKGDMVIVHAGEPHDVVGTGAHSAYTVAKFLPQILVSGEQTYREYSYALLLMESTHRGQEFFPSEESRQVELTPLFDRLMREWQEKDFGYELSLRADITQIFLHILRSWQKNSNFSADAEDMGVRSIMETAIFYINAHFSYLTEENVAAACGVSRSYFSRIFTRNMKTRFSAYVNEVRLREAERLLLTENGTVTEIAAATGFATTSHFISRFRAAFGITPARYRARHRAAANKKI